MPLGIAILTFFGFEFLVALTIKNLEIGFFPAIITAGFCHWVSAEKEQRLHAFLDNPAIVTFDIPITRAYASIKRVLKTFNFGERSWRLLHDERNNYSITAICQWKDYSMKDHKILVPDGYLFRQVILQVALRRNGETKLTEVGMRWTIESPMGRGECNELQAYTTVAVKKALRHLEIKE